MKIAQIIYNYYIKPDKTSGSWKNSTAKACGKRKQPATLESSVTAMSTFLTVVYRYMTLIIIIIIIINVFISPVQIHNNHYKE